MKKKYRKAGQIIFGAFLFAVLCIGIIAFIIYQNGLRYIKSDAGIKYFGTVDIRTNDIVDGRLWYENDAASVSLQKLFIVEAKDRDTAYSLPSDFLFTDIDYENLSGLNIDVLRLINAGLPRELTDYFPMNDFLFNISDERVSFKSERFEVLVKDYENIGNNIIGGEIWTYDGNEIFEWILNPTNTNPSSYKDFEIVLEENKARRYKGDVIEFIEKENVFFASFELNNGNFINLYTAGGDDIYRIEYDKGPRAGDLYIGRISMNFEQHGVGIYFYDKSGDIYRGDFLRGAKTGKGEFLFGGGDSYSGDMIDGRQHGEGVFRWSDGASYSGEISDNRKNGVGIKIFADGSVYEGDFVNDVKHGRGKYIFANGDVYEGDFANDLFEGSGQYAWASGDYYEGEFYQSAPHGEGTYVWTTGRTYRGLFSLGRMIQRPDTNAPEATDGE